VRRLSQTIPRNYSEGVGLSLQQRDKIVLWDRTQYEQYLSNEKFIASLQLAEKEDFVKGKTDRAAEPELSTTV
jgi:hypothetical protein